MRSKDRCSSPAAWSSGCAIRSASIAGGGGDRGARPLDPRQRRRGDRARAVGPGRAALAAEARGVIAGLSFATRQGRSSPAPRWRRWRIRRTICARPSPPMARRGTRCGSTAAWRPTTGWRRTWPTCSASRSSGPALSRRPRLGAAMLAACGVGMYPDLGAAAQAMRGRLATLRRRRWKPKCAMRGWGGGARR